MAILIDGLERDYKQKGNYNKPIFFINAINRKFCEDSLESMSAAPDHTGKNQQLLE